MNGKHHQIVCPASARLLDLDRVTEQLRGWLDPSIQCTVAEDIFSSLWSVAMLRREHETLLSHLMAS